MTSPNGVTVPTRSVTLTVSACAKLAGVHRDQVHRAMTSGVLPFHRDAEGSRVATSQDLLAWMATRPPTTPEDEAKLRERDARHYQHFLRMRGRRYVR